MKKVVLTEEQAKKLMGKVVSEQFRDDGRYHERVKCNILANPKMTFKGHEIDWIDDVEFDLSFLIDIEARSFGIKSISVYGFTGPESIEIDVSYFPNESHDTVTETVEIKLDWDNVVVDDDANLGYIGVSPDVELELKNDENGNLIAWGGPQISVNSL